MNDIRLLLAAYYASADRSLLPIIADAMETAGVVGRWLELVRIAIWQQNCAGPPEHYRDWLRSELPPITCFHASLGLCSECQAEHDEDPQAWIEYGPHPDGNARWESLQGEIAQAADDRANWNAADQDASVPF